MVAGSFLLKELSLRLRGLSRLLLPLFLLFLLKRWEFLHCEELLLAKR